MGKSSRLAIVVAGAWVFCLALLTLLCESRVGAVTFAYSGFEENSLHLVSNSAWIFDNTSGCFGFYAGDSDFEPTASGRLLYPGAVQMKDSGSTSVKSFSTSFIYQLQILAGDTYYGAGLAFGIVPDNTTLGGTQDFMGLITNETTETAKNYESDNHTLGVELDTFMNPEFSDPNNNHIGINLASMTSVYTFKPVYSLASIASSASPQQIWIDFFEADSRMDIYYANYKADKPATPQGSHSGLDLSLLKENMYIGFTTASKYGSFNIPCVCAWSFSNDGNPAPSIVIAQDATPGAPPPPAPVTSSPPPNDPVAAPTLPPPESLPASPPPPSRARSSPPFRAPNPAPSPSVQSPQGPNSEPPAITEKKNLEGYVIVPVSLAGSVGMIISIIVSLCWCRFRSHPLRIFISHAGGPTGSHKNFPTWLDETMRTWHWSVAKSRVKIFFDRADIEMGKSFIDQIFQELARFDMGVVVVTEAFFTAKWPMTELIAFVAAQRDDLTGRIRVLPLFYELSPEEVRAYLVGNIWEPKWKEWSTGNHPLQVEKCRDAVNWLCQQRGIPYVYERRDQDQVYIKSICKAVDDILCKDRSFGSYLIGAVKTHCIPRCSKPGKTIHENERALL